MESVVTIAILLTFLFGSIGLVASGCAKLLEVCNSRKEKGNEKPVVVEDKKETPVLVPKIYGKFDLFRRLNQVMQEALDCPIRSWDIWELGNGEPAVIEFLGGSGNIAIYNRRIAYCKTQDEICSALMDVSLSHDIVEFELTKSLGHTWSTLGIGVVSSTKDEGNIDADIIEAISNVVQNQLDGNVLIDDAVAYAWGRM
jgi:hypothetical protein